MSKTEKSKTLLNKASDAAKKNTVIKKAEVKPAEKKADPKAAEKKADPKAAEKKADPKAEKSFPLLFIKINERVFSMFLLLKEETLLEMHGNPDSFYALENRFGLTSKEYLASKEDVKDYPELVSDFETSRVFKIPYNG